MATMLRAFIHALLLVPLTASLIAVWPLQSIVPDGLTLFLAAIIGSLGLIGLRERTLYVPGLVIPVALILTVSIFSGALAEYSITTGLRWHLTTLTVLLLILPGLSRLRTELGDTAYTALLGRGLLVLGVLAAILSLLMHYGVFHWLEGQSTSVDARLKGIWRQPNLTTTTLWLAFLAGLVQSRDQKSRWLALTAILLIALVCGLAASRLNILFLIFSAILIAVAWKSSNITVRAQARWLAAGIGVFLIGLFALPPVVHKIEESFGRDTTVLLADREPTDRPRIIEHEKVVASMPEWSARQWAFGVGPGNYGQFSFDLPVQPKKGAGGQTTWLHSHNVLSMVLVEQGVLGLLVVLIIAGALVKRLWRIREQPHALPIAGGIGVLLLHSNVEFPLWYPWFASMLVALAIPLSSDYRVRVESSKLVPITGALLLIVSIATALNLASQSKTILTSVRANEPGQSEYAAINRLEGGSLLGPYATLAEYRQFSPNSSRLDSQVARAGEIAKWRPLDSVKVRETILLLMNGQSVSACETARRTTEHYPAAGPIIVQKAVTASMSFEIDIAHTIECVEAGLQKWDMDLATMQRRNNETIERLRERLPDQQ